MDDATLKRSKMAARQDVSARRNSLSESDRRAFSNQICNLVVDHLPIFENGTVGLFLPIKSEIDASSIAAPLTKRGYSLALPVTIGRTGMAFRAWEEDAPLVDAGFGTRGPDENASEVKPDCLIMPLLAFDAKGNRLGYGAGHYDRYISERILEGSKPYLIGLAFSLQQLDKVPVGRYDLPLDMIVTETGVITP